MPSCRQARGHAFLTSVPPSQQHHVWVSDDLLHRTFKAFSRKFHSSFRHHSCEIVFDNKTLACSIANKGKDNVGHVSKRSHSGGRDKTAFILSYGSAPCRFASAVPGPLESRRRAAKRRNTSLAQWDNPETTGKFGVILPPSSPDGQKSGIQPPVIEEKPKSSLLPVFL